MTLLIEGRVERLPRVRINRVKPGVARGRVASKIEPSLTKFVHLPLRDLRERR